MTLNVHLYLQNAGMEGTTMSSLCSVGNEPKTVHARQAL